MTTTPSPDPDYEVDTVEIDQVRAARQAIWDRYGRDPYRLVAHYIEMQEEDARRRLGPDTAGSE